MKENIQRASQKEYKLQLQATVSKDIKLLQH